MLYSGSLNKQVILLARHVDLYNADWLLHVPPSESSPEQIATLLASIGCVLEE